MPGIWKRVLYFNERLLRTADGWMRVNGWMGGWVDELGVSSGLWGKINVSYGTAVCPNVNQAAGIRDVNYPVVSALLFLC